ncbi:S41 family peptidase [Rhodoflexus sp.]
MKSRFYRMGNLLLLVFGLYAFATHAQQEEALWMRYPAISPDGQTIVFSYKGDLFKVPAAGGVAVPLTIHDAHNTMPVWSRDGKQIAFASDRHGNFDIFVMPAEGGQAKRLTFHSANDYPYDFTTDNQSVVFGTQRNDPSNSVRFPNRTLFLKLYSVPVKGGRSVMMNAAGTEQVHFNSKGNQIVFQDRKGYEDAWRKRHTSSVTRDIWLYDMTAKQYRKISGFEGEDREPKFSADDQSIYYLSEKNGVQNIFKVGVNGAGEQQLTQFKDHPVRHLTRTANDLLCFTWNGEIYTLKAGEQPKKVTVLMGGDFRSNTEKTVAINSGVSEMTPSPNGKEIAFIFRGEVFVTATESGTTKRITNTPYQERSLSWSPDGRSLYYAAERGESWDIMRSTIARKEESYFYASTLVNEEAVIATDKEEFQPELSPDGKEIAYLEERNILKVYNLVTKQSRVIIPAGQNFSYSDGDQSFKWSPDGKWIAARSNKGRFNTNEILVFKADGSDTKGIDITQSGFGESIGGWAMDGKALLFSTDRNGRKSLAYQGARENDVYAVFFDKAAADRFRLSKEDFDLLKEREDKEKKEKKDSADVSKKAWTMNFDRLDERKIRLTTFPLTMTSYALSPDGEKLYLMARMDKNYDVWTIETRTKELKLLAKLNADGGRFEMSKDGKTLFALVNGRISKIATADGKVTPVNIQGEMTLNTAGERAYIFEHAWRQVKKKFYDPQLHGLDWVMYRKAYERFLPHISNNYDFQELLSEMLGELNASHTGGRYSPRFENPDATASLGLFYDEMAGGNGLKITDVIAGGPLDNTNSMVRAGHVIEKINGTAITADMDWAQLLNRKTGERTLLSLFNPASGQRWEEVVKPISLGDENSLLYRRWVNTMREMTEKLSGGKVGYVHVQGMNDGSFRTVYEEVLGKNINKEALIVDTRFNGGGWLHDDLVTFLGGKQYLTFAPYGFKSQGGEPLNKWTKPSCVLMSEGNYSDAFIFPYAYKQLGIGKLIGKPVPGTGTAVWWETQIDPTMVFGIPMIATMGKEGRPTENLQINPDIDVDNDYNSVLSGKDLQLERAVAEMLKEIK